MGISSLLSLMTQMDRIPVSFFSETCGDIRHDTILYPVHNLVGVRIGKRPTALNVRAHLDIVKHTCIKAIRQFLPTGVPCRLYTGFLDQTGQTHNLSGLTVATHKAHTGNIIAVTLKQPAEHLIIKRITYILLQLRAMAARAAIRTLGEVKR